MFERYDYHARRVVFFSRYEASQYGSHEIAVEHLLFGILRECRNVLTEIAPNAPADFEKAWREKVEPSGRRVSTSVDLPLSNESKRVLAYAAEEAERYQDDHIVVEHLVLGLLRERHRASEMLEQIGISLERARKQIEAKSYVVTPREGAGPESALGVPFVLFVDVSGVEVAVVPVGSLYHLPRAGDVVEIESASGFVVKEIRHVFVPLAKRWPHKDHELAEIVVKVERVEE